ncbi:MAG: orotate phosphoribosyltransferase [Elusimicrobiota bacterium]
MDKETLFKESKAIQKGHFLLASGKHSQFYFQAQNLLKYPDKAHLAGKLLSDLWSGKKIDVVVSLAIGGIVLGQEVARHLGARHIFLERKGKHFSLERGFQVHTNEKTLLVEDVITTGGSVKEAIKILENLDADIAGICSLVLRGSPDFKYPLKTLRKINWPVYKPKQCPLCKKKIPLYVPGTKQKKSR